MSANGSTLQADLDALQSSETAFRSEVANVGAQREKAAQGLIGEANAAGQADIKRAQDFASTQQPFNQSAPSDQIGQVMAGAPWLFALAALGGKASKLHGLAMLQGLNGVSAGLIKGDEEALNQSWNRYNAAFDKWKANADQQQRIFSELEGAYGRASDGRLRALQAALSITDDNMKMKLQVDDPKRLFDMQEKVKEQDLRLQEWKRTRDLRDAQIENLRSLAQTRGAKVGAKETERKAKLSSAITQIDSLMEQLKEHPWDAGARGYLKRGTEFIGSNFGRSTNLPAHKFQADMEALLLQIPKLLTGSSRSAKDERARVDEIANALRLGETAGTGLEKLRALRDILTEAALDPSQVAADEEPTAAEIDAEMRRRGLEP